MKVKNVFYFFISSLDNSKNTINYNVTNTVIQKSKSIQKYYIYKIIIFTSDMR